MTLAHRIAPTVDLPLSKVEAALTLFEEGATIPFVARYRREATGGLDEVELRAIEEARHHAIELDQRRATIIRALTEQKQLTPELQAKLDAAETRSALDDLYAPFKQRRKTRGDKARALGLGPLAELIRSQDRRGDPITGTLPFLGEGVPDIDAALQGARDIVAEQIALDPALRSLVRQDVGDNGQLTAKATSEMEPAYEDYADHSEPFARMPPHRYLAVCRGEAAGALRVKVRPDGEHTRAKLIRAVGVDRGSRWADQLELAAGEALDRLMFPAAERRVRRVMRERAEDAAIEVFQRNLEAVLLASPLGPVPVLGVDPGIRTGCKCALVSGTGNLEDHRVVYLVGRTPRIDDLARWLGQIRPGAIAVGNGTGGREALAAVREAVAQAGIDAHVVSISETGASVYSASDQAREEMPDVDLTVRGAAHLARRLQDPLAELVKVPPQAMGVGQYQHDLDQNKLSRRLDAVVESCVNRVGVDLSTASAALLARVAGIGPRVAEAIVDHRRRLSAFSTRQDLLGVAGLGAKTFEQCAGFLRIRGGPEPLDGSAVHPERYGLVGRMAADLGVAIGELVGRPETVARVRLDRYTDEATGVETLADIAEELCKPGRDPRSAFEAPQFREDVREPEDLREGMILEGVVTNVTDFGAFVDLGVHQDGLVHISQLADHFVRDPHAEVRAGQKVRVKVLGVDLKRRRISLTRKDL